MKSLFTSFLTVIACCTIATAQKYKCGDDLPLLVTALQKAKLDSQLLNAVNTFKADSLNAENIIWLGRRYGYTGAYQKAIDVFTYGIRQHPNDARMYRHRGHRYITIRCFDKAVDDLNEAARLVANKPDMVEEDGQPNEFNTPVSTLHQNIYYHLGLAWYCKQNLEEAEKAFRLCYEKSNNDDSRVSSANWLYLILRLQMKNEAAKQLLTEIPAAPMLLENKVYFDILQLHRTQSKPEVIDAQQSSKSTAQSTAYLYGLIMYYRLNGYEKEEKQARKKMQESDQVASFGFIAEEHGLK